MPSTSAPATVRDLRRRWKPHKESLQAVWEDHPTAVLLHRAFSWLARVEGVGSNGSANDVVLVCKWIALIALDGRWDSVKCEPAPDQTTWRAARDSPWFCFVVAASKLMASPIDGARRTDTRGVRSKTKAAAQSAQTESPEALHGPNLGRAAEPARLADKNAARRAVFQFMQHAVTITSAAVTVLVCFSMNAQPDQLS
jgi:hypothetical protein